MSPACAGMIPLVFALVEAAASEPRMRGDDPAGGLRVSLDIE